MGLPEGDFKLIRHAFSTSCVGAHRCNRQVIKNSKDFFDQSLDEIKLLQYINSRGDPDKHHVLEVSSIA